MEIKFVIYLGPSHTNMVMRMKDNHLIIFQVYGPNWQMYKSMHANIEHWQWYAINNGNDNADLLSVTYVKEYDDTGLRLTSNGGHRTIVNGGYSQCGRWYES